ncbi:MAG: hypothetical protein ABSH41_02270 [Syntrophobacteraceae bacterium]
MKIRRTRIKRVLIAWIILFFLTLIFVAKPTGFSWGYWVYGLIWGAATTLVLYLFPRVFVEEVEI